MAGDSTNPESIIRDISKALTILKSASKDALDLIQGTEGTHTTLDESCELAIAFSGAKAETKQLYETVSRFVIQQMGTLPDHTLGDGTIVERRQGSARKKWDHISLARSVTEKLMQMAIDMDTGEMTMSNQDVAIRMLEYVAPSYWRVKKLSDIGINADMYCETSEGNINLVIRTKGDNSDDEQ